jgi:hypothetical protein
MDVVQTTSLTLRGLLPDGEGAGRVWTMVLSPSSRHLTGVLATLGFLAGCGRTEAVPVTLADLKDRTLQFVLNDVDSLERASISGSHRFTLLFSGSEAGCIRLADGVRATFNGRPMALEPGGVPDTGLGGREVCVPPRATFDFDPGQWRDEPSEDIRVILQDDSHHMLLIVHEAKAKRNFLRVAGDPSRLRRGLTYAYVWVPESDTLQAPAQATLLPKDGSAPASLEVTQEGPTALFTVPLGTVEGPYILRLSATAHAEVLTCEGVAGCQGGLFHSEEFDVSVTP